LPLPIRVTWFGPAFAYSIAVSMRPYSVTLDCAATGSAAQARSAASGTASLPARPFESVIFVVP